MISLETIESSQLVAPGPRATSSLKSRAVPLVHPEEQLRVLDSADVTGGPTNSGRFGLDLAASGWPRLKPDRLEIVQINLGKLCNMTCMHCHVDSGPDRTEENMDRATVDACLQAIDRSGAQVVDLTGGAPELNPNFEYLVEECVSRGLRVLDRCNLTVLLTRRCEHLPEWFAERGVEIICSLPHHRKIGTDAQRGDGTYKKSIKALRRLNEVGYGYGDPDRQLTLVTNPVGAFLAGNQASLEREWKTSLTHNHDVSFDRLLTLNNLPMSRYLEWLMDTNQVDTYLSKLLQAFNPATIAGLMCRNTLSIGWDGHLYDCDFNQQLEMQMDVPHPHVADFDLGIWQSHSIRTARHCYGCTAGAGSSCGGAIT
ncbi:MAG: arsenosugar biosynthesis radical SAM protein ArsS [Bacteroidetes bacterium]|nr:arsenosugar biosynthesis radical SAM protein ArsS [Bacteroidota bacterium]MDE2671833.1 arsenosugar biosynthesis radical SAM protein ArsS [Bacteroidota bacterium]